MSPNISLLVGCGVRLTPGWGGDTGMTAAEMSLLILNIGAFLKLLYLMGLVWAGNWNPLRC